MATAVTGQADFQLRISGLTLTAPMTAGQPLQCEFTATNISNYFTADNFQSSLTGCVVGPTGVVMAVMGVWTVTLSPFGSTSTIGPGQSVYVHLTSTNPLPSVAAGQQATLYVGFYRTFAGVSVNQAFTPQASVVLSVTKLVGGGGTNSYPYPTSGNGSNGITPIGKPGLPVTFAGLTPTNWAAIGAGAALLVGGVWLYRTFNPPELAAARVQARATEEYAGALRGLAPAGRAYARRYRRG